MTTSVFYDSLLRLNDLGSYQGASSTTTVGGATPKQIYDNINTFLDTGVTLVQQVNNSASTTNPNATFASTPTNGNAMIALVVRGSDNIASTGPAGWTQLTANGAAAARRLEVWWKRAGASEAKLHTWTNATAALWEVTLIEFGGWAAIVDPIVVLTAANLTSGASATFNQTGMLETVCAVVTSGGSAGTFSNNSSNIESTTDLPFTTTTRFRAMSIDAWTNRPTTSAGTNQTASISWTTARASTRAQVGWPNGTEDTFATYYTVGNNAQNTAGIVGQLGMSFNTASIPDGDTVVSATLTLTAPATAGYPTNSAVNVYSVSTIAADNSNTRTVWRKPTEIQALTRVATRAAGSAWNVSTSYAWTSDATFPAAISKTGSTHLLVATGDQQAGTLRNTTEQITLSAVGGTVHYLTVVHDLVIARAGGLATTEIVSGVTRLVNVLLGIGGKATDEAFGGIRRTDLTAIIGSISTSEQFGGAALAVALTRIGSISSGELVAGISSITSLGFLTLLVGGVATNEAFGSFTIYKIGGSVVAAHTVTGVVVASAPTITGLVSAVEALTGVTASTHLLQP